MREAPLPDNEQARLAALRALAILDTPQEERLDRITRIASAYFDVPICLVSLVDENRQWFKSCVGLEVRETPRTVSFCAHAILSDDALVISDSHADERFHDNPLVTGPPHVRFYAGQPLSAPGGEKLGTLCVIDHRPRRLDAAQLGCLRDLAAWTENELANAELASAVGDLRESEARLRAIMESVAEAIVTFGSDGRVLTANPAAEAIFRVPAERLVGGPVDSLIEGADWTQISRRLELPADESELAIVGRRQAVEGRRRDGSIFPLELVVSEAPVHGSRLFIGVGQDITERTQSERLKDEFISIVGHELRTPLTSIRGSLGLIAGGVMGELAPEVREMLGLAVDNADRLGRLINDILDIERMQSGRAELSCVPLPANGLVADSIRIVQPIADECEVTLSAEVSPGATVTADADRIVQTLTNLINNAVKFAPARTSIAVGAERTGDEVVFSVRDSGRGIPADELDLVFERFHQVDASDAREKGGTGLGLAIARSIVEQHGGRIWAESREGQGATFCFTLPACPSEGEPAPAGTEGPARVGEPAPAGTAGRARVGGGEAGA
jgi:PAS domain S-box-containing protein